MIKSDGELTYFAADIAYHRNKLERSFGKLINVWGADHHGYVPRLKAAMQGLGYDTASCALFSCKWFNLPEPGNRCAWVNAPENSSRSGSIGRSRKRCGAVLFSNAQGR